MRKISSLSLCAVNVFFLLIFLTSPSYAYLDPNAGSLLAQIALGGFAMVLLFVRLFFRRIKSFFKSKNDG